MSKVAYIIHLFILIVIQLLLLDNIHLSSYVYLNIYVLAVIMAPDDLNDTLLLLLGFITGLVVDFANNTMGVHTAATTLLAYLRPTLLGAVSIRQNSPVKTAIRGNNTSWVMKYLILTLSIYMTVLLMLEAFSFRAFHITLLRIVCSTAASFILMMLYYFTAIITSNKHE